MLDPARKVVGVYLAVMAHLLVVVGSAPADTIEFSRDIQPILADNCFQCHGPDAKARKADLRLDKREEAVSSGVIRPGRSGESELIRRISSDDPEVRMPPPTSDRRLSEPQKQLLKRWIDEGAKYARHWAFMAPVRPPVPPAPPDASVRNPIDAFIAAALAKRGLTQSPQAEPAKLLRRVSLDLTGLPPTPEELDAFLANPSEAAYTASVQRLLDSPRYGQRMVWEWLDAARYADTNGYQGDPTRAMWYWRDWAIQAFNRNMPFDEFTIEQIAGDLLPSPAREQLIATGFHRNHMINGEGGRIAEESRVEYVQDRVETTGTVWMGLTLTCCRCHDHKYDPFTQKEYYQLAAYFNSIDESGANDAGGLANPLISVASPEQEAKLAALRAAEKAVTERKAVTDAERSAARKAREEFERQLPRTMVMRDRPQPRDTFVLTRGAYNAPGAKVSHGVLTSLSPLPPGAPQNRLALARWLVSPQHPLTARVTVNRLWQQFFGIGLVKSTEDFGVQGDRPSHPELLDWLAVDFRDSGWDVKRLVRLIVTSHAYRQSARVAPGMVERDPENRLLARGPRHRLPSWMIRDQALAVSGLLVERVGGPPVKGYQPPGVWEDATFGQIRYQQDHGEALYRRSLYTFWRRIVAPTLFFDVANRQNCTVKNSRTNTPLHALVTLNDVTYVEAARALAQRTLLLPTATDDYARLRDMFRRCTARLPQANETRRLVQRLATLREVYGKDAQAAKKLLAVGESKPDGRVAAAELASWTGIASLVLNLDETITNE
jgi:hypothetical protein